MTLTSTQSHLLSTSTPIFNQLSLIYHLLEHSSLNVVIIKARVV